MKFEEYWSTVIKSNPWLENTGMIRMTIEEYRKRLKMAHEQGVEEGKKSTSLFERIFGK